MNSVQPIAYFLMRQTRLGPLLPVRLWWCNYEPGEPSNLLDRGRFSVYPRADIGGDEVDPQQIFDRTWSGTDSRPAYATKHWKYAQPITEAQYQLEMERLRWNERYRPQHPTLKPRRAVNIDQLPLPDFERENAI